MPSVSRSIKRALALLLVTLGVLGASPVWASATCTYGQDGQLVCQQDPTPSGGNGSSDAGASSGSGVGMVSGITGWLADAVKSLVKALATLLHDMSVSFISMIFELVVMIVQAIPIPDFLQGFSLSGLLGGAAGQLGYFINILKIPAGLGAVGAGYAFRLLRKFLTLFQW